MEFFILDLHVNKGRRVWKGEYQKYCSHMVIMVLRICPGKDNRTLVIQLHESQYGKSFEVMDKEFIL